MPFAQSVKGSSRLQQQRSAGLGSTYITAEEINADFVNFMTEKPIFSSPRRADWSKNVTHMTGSSLNIVFEFLNTLRFYSFQASLYVYIYVCVYSLPRSMHCIIILEHVFLPSTLQFPLFFKIYKTQYSQINKILF